VRGLGGGVNAAVAWHELRLFFIALQSLTRVPVPAWVGGRADWAQASARHYPTVGVAVGLVGTLVLWSAAHLWPAAVAVGLSMAATVWLTGAIHEHGLAGTCDALGGAVSRERALEIMQDSRLGTYGTIGLVAVLGLKAAALHGLAQRDFALVLVALPFAHAMSRLAPVLLLRLLADAGGAAQASDGTLFGAVLVGALASAAAVALGLDPLHALVALAAALAVTLAMARWLRIRLGGCTGATLGAAQLGAELVIYLVLLAARTSA
jgi:adenosylcobinamide-GDP ribazoletransferase